jgi:hypothetical protein
VPELRRHDRVDPFTVLGAPVEQRCRHLRHEQLQEEEQEEPSGELQRGCLLKAGFGTEPGEHEQD